MNIVILGAGESGVGAAILAQQKGHQVFVSDRGVIAEKYKAALAARGIPYEEGHHTQERILSADEVIKSPGIPDKVPLVRELVEKGIPVISEIEFAGRYTDAVLIGITGSNGKTTTTSLTWHLLNTAGLNVGLAGNVGRSFAWSVAEDHYDYYALELSSFQLDGIRQFRSQFGLLLNITPDHLDRYDYQMSNYIRSKFRITLNQGEGDYFLYREDDPNIAGYLQDHQVKARQIAIHEAMIKGTGIQIGGCYFDLSATRLFGRHNALNALFAVKVAQLLGVGEEVIRQGLQSFQPVPHRMEGVGSIRGVEFINDSKATNVDSVYFALQAMTRPVIWVLGGQDKGNDYEPLMPFVREKVKSIICLGIDNRKIFEAFQKTGLPIVETKSADDAVRQAFEQAQSGDVVLLSPACASFDLFKNYEDRGDQFRQAVQKLKNEKSE